ncbi:catabolite control protein A [Paenibacillus baekrokdamisoli]|uniref:Catabolite control protein A n=1 Tax=Paenibacillus baekrokdamisoli TaxID=1712516 RepID=A0A3G9IZS4_9BACL|nr:LacI family DNA-binding transcriptional regulator [Paenibacillus baekrokdamisoli]MBB3072889.1 LacI family transcriptional regulator [Paenibacillus baekrokdamisoli]BBH24447.1 catabolite control protein A [Paenibacillus baekrokdamisoli]
MDIKIIDVATQAGVSAATVSRVLNGNSQVKQRTREKVKRAILELGYYPNAVAKNLRSQKSMMIGIIVPDINASYYTDIIKGIENMAYSRKYRVIICDAKNDREHELEYLNLLISRTIDGMILATTLLTDEELGSFSDRGYNVALIGRNIEHDGIPCIFTDNVKFSREVVYHLVEQGHRDIVFLSGYAESVDSYERLEGYLKGLKEYTIPFRPELVENGDFNETGGYEAMNRLFDKGLLFTAVYAANDEMALGVYRACRERGIQIPQQLAIVGVDNNRISKYLSPTLSTVNQPKYTMGAVIAEKLIDQMVEKEFNDMRVFKVDSELIVRGSSSFRREQ